MKTIVSVNTSLPTIDNCIDYLSGESLLDYDIVLFNPGFPLQERKHFTGGGSCISLESTKELKAAISHWNGEISEALKAGKTIFFILNQYLTDDGTTGYTTGARGIRNWSTFSINNYEVLPVKVSVRNAKGKQLKVVDIRFKGLYDAIRDIAEFKVVFTSEISSKVFTTKDESNVVSAVAKMQNASGHLVFLPYFDFMELTEHDDVLEEDEWTKEAVQKSKRVVGQLIELDKILQSQSKETPRPEWFDAIRVPKKVTEIDEVIRKYDNQIESIIKLKEKEAASKKDLLTFSALLYENGKPLELAIEKSLKLLGYEVENFQKKDLEIDHIIISPEGKRMIGESEGKDNTAIDISKFRQLESNINEDFERPEIETPAKGIIFGNSYRLIDPAKRKDQFTQKCLTNARRLGTALVQTADLYDVVLHILNNPADEKFKKSCRKAIETTSGDIVKFPTPSPGED
jgi:vacuolar-type H+-ATPase subunit D/Vma8